MIVKEPSPGLKEFKESSVGLGRMNTKIKAKRLIPKVYLQARQNEAQ